MATDTATLLADAKAAYHDLLTGKAVASVRDQSGEEIRYTQADRAALAAYVSRLQSLVDAAANPCVHPVGPMRIWF